MSRTHKRGLRLLSIAASLAVAASLALVPAAVEAHVLPSELDVDGEVIVQNRGDRPQLVARLNQPAPQDMQIDFENECGPNDTEGIACQNAPEGEQQVGHESPDHSCVIPAGTTECTPDPATPEYTEQGRDRIRVWIDHGYDPSIPQANARTISNSHVEADLDEGRDETQNPGSGCQEDPNGPRVRIEPDCTDVVDVFTEILEIIPELQVGRQPGTTIRLEARSFTPAPPTGVNVDIENENGSNDPDRSNSPTTPDFTCDIEPGESQCVVEYVGQGGTDVLRGWIDNDRTQSTVEADPDEGRFSGGESGGPGHDCGHPGDVNRCGGGIRVGQPGDPIFFEQENPTPGSGCRNPRSTADTTFDRAESDCTDVVEVRFDAGPAALLDCDDQAGTQSGNDTEREVNPSDPNRGDADDAGSTEEYRCRVTDVFGAGRNGIVVKGEITNGTNDPDPASAEAQPSYEQLDYSCTTRTDEKQDPPGTQNVIGAAGVCYMRIAQSEGELGTANICFWVGTAAEGASLCNDEITGENQQADGTDTANDLADHVEKTWENAATFRLDCSPETDTNPAGSAHTITCTSTSTAGAQVNGVNIDAEATGPNDPDMSNTQATPEFSCTTQTAGSCSFTHGPGGQGSTSAEGTTVYRAWIDADSNNVTMEADATEVRDENTTPGARPEPDNTDVVDKVWGPPANSLAMTPESDSARVGDCNPFTITLRDRNNNPVQGAAIDLEQRHERATNQANNDEPTVSFCDPDPAGGPNTSDVDESRGDLGPPTENPDNRGTTGGETVGTTDQNGQITIGVEIAPGQGSNGSGSVAVSAFFETADNDDPDTGEPSDSSTKTWQPAAGEPGVPAALDLQPNFSSDPVGSFVEYTATVSDANGDPVEGARIEWSEEGAGSFADQQSTTDSDGRARAIVSSDEEGTQEISAGASDCGTTGGCSDTSTQTWVALVRRGACKGYGEGTRRDTDGDGDEDVIVGTSGDDVITGTNEGDLICGLDGNDSIDGAGGNDRVHGDAGRDSLRGNSGNDRLKGGGGNDVLEGGSGNDLMNGGGGKDVLQGGPGTDRLVGSGGNDSMNGGPGRDRCSGGPGRDRERSC